MLGNAGLLRLHGLDVGPVSLPLPGGRAWTRLVKGDLRTAIELLVVIGETQVLVVR